MPKKQDQWVLTLRDWGIVNAQFALALCCLSKDHSSLGRKIDNAVGEGLTHHEFLTWALFTKVRGHPIFAEKMLEHFGIIIELSDQNSDSEAKT